MRKYNHTSGVYIITCLINNKYYIGESDKVEIRLINHKSDLKRGVHDNVHLQAAYNKYGIDNFTFELLEECEPAHTCSFENYWCNLLNTHNRKYGYNKRKTNPDGKVVMSEETIQKAIATRKRNNKPSHLKGTVYTEERKKQMSEITKAWWKDPNNKEKQDKIRKAPIGKTMTKEVIDKATKARMEAAAKRGYYHTEETKKKIGEKHKGNKYCLGLKRPKGIKKGPRTEETKQKLSKANKGKKRTEEQKAYMSKKAKEKFASGERVITEEQKQKMREKMLYKRVHPNRKIILQYDSNDNFIKEWESSSDIKHQLGYGDGNIHRACKTGIKANGFKWKYKEDLK